MLIRDKAIPLQARTDWGLQEVEAPRISRQLAHKVVSLLHWPPLPLQEVLLVLNCVRHRVHSRFRA